MFEKRGYPTFTGKIIVDTRHQNCDRFSSIYIFFHRNQGQVLKVCLSCRVFFIKHMQRWYKMFSDPDQYKKSVPTMKEWYCSAAFFSRPFASSKPFKPIHSLPIGLPLTRTWPWFRHPNGATEVEWNKVRQIPIPICRVEDQPMIARTTRQVFERRSEFPEDEERPFPKIGDEIRYHVLDTKR